MVSQKEKDCEIYNLAKEYLCNIPQVSQEILEKYLSTGKPGRLEEVYRRILESGKNRDMMRNVVEKAIGSVDEQSSILCEFNPQDIIEKYGSDDEAWRKVLAEFQEHNVNIGNINPRSLVAQYCKVIISGATFLSRFNTLEKFFEWVDEYDKDDCTRDKFFKLQNSPRTEIRLLSIFGFRLPLACDFLKEIGYLNFSKPDRHLKKIFASLNLCGAPDDLPDDLEVIRVIGRIAYNVGVTPYNVDKLFWLIGSGKFYQHPKINRIRRGDEFVKYATENL